MRVGGPRASVPDEIRAWALFAQGDLQGAIKLLRPVAGRKGKIGKGEVELPAREMLAEMFSSTETSLKRHTNTRYHSPLILIATMLSSVRPKR